ncbi:hypothetical protein F1559_004065 [Cyanidiococcus yangmingshanensis]|uniref:Uncharacterized protein n=1 Tax=Cyanidiococcus yangmingshanensis TaxID=2690220 RepID=A0A7J7II10_9RHOD|nr:hypothetical protein F1559_004065 [Cyanidiococcus yangmingshanensis]
MIWEIQLQVSVQAMDLSESDQTIAIGIPHQFQIVNGETLKTQWNCNLERSPRTIYSEHKRLADLHWTCACFVDPQKPALVLGAHANGPIFLFDTRQTQVARTLELSSREASRANALSGFAKAYEILPDCPSGPVRLCAPTKTATHPLTSTVLALTRVPQRHSTVLASTDDGMMLSLDLLRDQASMLLKASSQ